MKKPVIILVSALVLAGASMGTFIAVKNKKDAEESMSQSQLADNVLFDFDDESVDKIEFDIHGDVYTVVKDGDTGWVLSGRDDFAMDQVYMQLISTYTSNLTAEECYGQLDDANRTMYGFDDPIKISLTENGNVHELFVGNESPTGDFYYVTTGDKNKVYAIDSYKGASLVPTRLTLKSKKLVPYEYDQIADITMKKDGKVTCRMVFDPENKQWSLDKEYDKLDTDQTAISSMITNIIRLDAEDLLDENLADLDGYGFDKPDNEVIINGIDGSKRTFFTKVSENDPTLSYVLIDEDKQVESFYTSDLDFAASTPYDYIIRNVKCTDMYSIKGFDFEIDGEKAEITLDTENKKCEINGKTVDISNSEGYTIFQNFYDSFSMLPVEGLDMDAKPDESNTIMSAVYHGSDGKDTSVSVVSDGGKYYIFKNGEYTGAYAPADRFSGRTSIMEFFNKLRAYSV